MKFSPIYDRSGQPWYVRESKIRALASTFHRSGDVAATVVTLSRLCGGPRYLEITWSVAGSRMGFLRFVASDALPEGGESGEPVLGILRAAIALRSRQAGWEVAA